MATTGNYVDLLDAAFRVIFYGEVEARAKRSEYDKVFKTPPASDRNYEKESAIIGFGVMGEKPEGHAYTEEDPIQGFDKTYTHVPYGTLFRVSEEMWDDDLFGKMNQMPQALGLAAAQAVEVVAAGHWNNGFSDSYTGPDSEPLFGDATTKIHAQPSGGVASVFTNQLSTAADLSVTSLEALIQIMEDAEDEKGMLLTLKPAKLIVPLELKWQARELLDSDDKPYTANNEINPLSAEELKYFVYHWLTDADAFFLQSEQHYMRHYWRKKPIFRSDKDVLTEDGLFKCYQRFSNGWTHWFGVAGSPGA